MTARIRNQDERVERNPHFPTTSSFLRPREGPPFLVSSRGFACYPFVMDAIVTLTDRVSNDPLQALQTPPPGPSMVEIRADLLPGLDIAQAVRTCPLPVLVTYRSQREHGHGSNDPTTRRRILAQAWESGAHLIDIELDRDTDAMDALGIDPERVVLSWHDPEGTPDTVVQVARKALESRARWVKIVSFAHSVRDLGRILSIHALGVPRKRREARVIAFAMGTIGLPSRYLSPLLNAPVTYVAWNESAAAAPGQLTFDRLNAAIGHLSAPPKRLFGVVGHDVSGSLSPQLHGAAYRACDLPYAMLPFSVPTAAEAALLFRTGGSGLVPHDELSLCAFAVTSPYKGLALSLATIAAPRSRRAEAANTLIVKPHQILADTTDADGVVGALIDSGIDPRGTTALVQGTGGAARGAAVGLDLAGAQVILRGRDPVRTAAIAKAIDVASCGPGDLPKHVTILVNATPLGTRADDPSPFTASELNGCQTVIDMVYAPHRTELAGLAAQAKVQYIGGRTMLLFQGMSQFAAMTSHTPPREAMRTALFAEDDHRLST